MRIHTTHTRDAGLRQLRRINRWTIAGSIALTGVLSDVAAHAFPGKTIKASASGKSGSGKHATGSPAKAAKPLTPPAAPPRSAEESAPAHESPPATEAAPSQESREAGPSRESAPSQESAPSHEAAPAPEAPSEAAPAPESAPPVVSGGS